MSELPASSFSNGAMVEAALIFSAWTKGPWKFARLRAPWWRPWRLNRWRSRIDRVSCDRLESIRDQITSNKTVTLLIFFGSAGTRGIFGKLEPFSLRIQLNLSSGQRELAKGLHVLLTDAQLNILRTLKETLV